MTLKRMKVYGRDATVAFMTKMFGGELVEPADASYAIVKFDDGEIAYFKVRREAN